MRKKIENRIEFLKGRQNYWMTQKDQMAKNICREIDAIIRELRMLLRT
mgnify:CR=1 FL=1